MPTIPTPADPVALAADAEAALETAWDEWQASGVARDDAERKLHDAQDALADADQAAREAEDAQIEKREAWHIARIAADSAQAAADTAELEAEDAAVRDVNAQDEAIRVAWQADMEEAEYSFQEPDGGEHRYP